MHIVPNVEDQIHIQTSASSDTRRLSHVGTLLSPGEIENIVLRLELGCGRGRDFLLMMASVTIVSFVHPGCESGLEGEILWANSSSR